MLDRVVDSHVHLLEGAGAIGNLSAIREAAGADRMCIACIQSREDVNENPSGFAAKSAYPERFYVFAGLDHSAKLSEGRAEAPALAEQVDRLVEIGADGIKLLETKPDRRKVLDIPIDSDYYEPFFARVEEVGLPVLWHVADPPEFWDAALTPKWAAEQGWGYDESFVPWERLYTEVISVLRQHPRLRVIFPHFFFLSGDLPKAQAVFDEFPSVHFDLAPGIEMLYNLSTDPARAREFFTRNASRVIYGTDIWGEQTMGEAVARANLVRRWLETGEEYRIPAGADCLLGPPEDGVIRGMELPREALEMIYHANFERLVGVTPRPLNRQLAADECRRIARERGLLSGNAADALRAADSLSPGGRGTG